MKKAISVICSAIMALQLLFSAAPVFAEETAQPYTEPESPAVTYNMNLDWRFKESPVGMGEARKGVSVQTAWEAVAVGGKQFYEVGYDDSEWQTVSIPHGINGEDAFTSNTKDAGGGMGRLGVFLYRKTFTVPQAAEGGKVFFELEGIRQSAYVWVNGKPVGYYEAGIAAFGFDITSFVKPGETAIIAIANDCSATSGNTARYAYETVPGDSWGSSYTPDNFDTSVGGESGIIGAGYQWNVRNFNETQAGLVYDAYLHITGSVYQTFPLYNNLKTTGNYIYADDFDFRSSEATITVDSEVRNESGADGNYTLEVAVVDNDGKLVDTFTSGAKSVAAATDAGVVYETAVESDVYSEENISNPVGKTKVNTPDVTHITASKKVSGLRFWTDTDPYLYTVYTVLRDASGKAVDVQKKETGFRKVTYDSNQGVLINDKPVWLKGYAQRSTNEWAVIGIAPDWLQDYDMALLKENNANFIRWMHVAPKPAEVRSSDRYGVIVVCPAGDKEGDASGRTWSQRVEAMRDAMIYFRNSPSVLFWETGNSAVSASHAQEMAALRDTVDPKGMRFIGARSTKNVPDALNYDYNYAGTMYGNYAGDAISAMKTNKNMGPIMETEYAREESPRRVWDDYSPPDYDYVNKALHGNSKKDGYDAHDQTQESITVDNVRQYYGYYNNRAQIGGQFAAEAMMIWSDSNMHGRNSASENCRTSGRVDAVRQTKEMFEGTRVAHSDEPAVHIVGHWSYPEYGDDTYNYFDTEEITLSYNDDGTRKEYYDRYTDKKLKRNPLKKTVYVIGSANVSEVKLYRVDNNDDGTTKEELIGTDKSADRGFIYQFDDVNVTIGDGVIAKAYDVNGDEIKTDKKVRTGDAASIRLTPHTAVKEGADGETESDWRADGGDIAYFDVEVLDANGNVCVLNYDKISFKWTGEGEYLGGYNSGVGSGCYQNSTESQGLSFYFGGEKNVSVIRQPYVYAENGTNRIFVKSTRKAGDFTLTASMDIEGMMDASATITSVPVEMDSETGLTLETVSRLKPGLSSEAPSISNTSAMYPLIAKKLINWKDAKIDVEVDTNVYYDVYVNGTKLDIADNLRAKASSMDGGAYGPIEPVLKALQGQGVTYTKATNDGVTEITFTVGQTAYTIREGSNQLYWDNQSNETVDGASAINGELFAHYDGVFQYVTGIGVTQNNDAKTVNITYTKQ